MKANPIAEIRELDERLLGAVAGQEREAAEWIAQRQDAIRRFLNGNPDLEGFREIQEQTRCLEERFLHWRRASIMELSLIEQHLRYLSEQEPEAALPAASQIDVSG